MDRIKVKTEANSHCCITRSDCLTEAPPLPPPLSVNHHFICYAPRDGGEHALRLYTALQQAGKRPWLDRRDTPAGADTEAAREEALRECASVLLVLTPGSANLQSESAREWRRALQFKKPIVPVRFAPGIALPLILGQRTVLDFSGPFDKALVDLRRHLDELSSPAGQVAELEYRLADAEHGLRGAPDDPRIARDIAQLEAELSVQRAVGRDPQAAAAHRPGLFSGPPHRKPPRRRLPARPGPPPANVVEAMVGQAYSRLDPTRCLSYAHLYCGNLPAARAINRDPGIVQRATRLLDQLEGVPRFWE